MVQGNIRIRWNNIRLKQRNTVRQQYTSHLEQHEKQWEILTKAYNKPTEKHYTDTSIHDKTYGITAINNIAEPVHIK